MRDNDPTLQDLGNAILISLELRETGQPFVSHRIEGWDSSIDSSASFSGLRTLADISDVAGGYFDQFDTGLPDFDMVPWARAKEIMRSAAKLMVQGCPADYVGEFLERSLREARENSDW